MFRLTQAGFWTAAVATTFMTTAMVLPFWLGRRDNLTNYFIGLWYRLDCSDQCVIYNKILETSTISLLGRTYSFDVVSIVVLTIISLIFAFVGILILDITSCKSRYNIFHPRLLLLGVTILFLVASVSALIAFFMGIYLADEYYQDNMINHASEFPWSLLLWAIATLLIIISTVMFTYIICNWYNYSDSYGGSIFSDGSNSDEVLITGSSGRYYRNNTASEVPPLSIDGGLRKTRDLRGSGYATDYNSNFGRSEPSYFNFRLSNSKKSLSANDLRVSKKGSREDLRTSRMSLHDSPRILRNTTVSDYIIGEQGMRASRIVPIEGGTVVEEVIDPRQLSTVRPSFRESRVNDGSGYITDIDNSATILSSRRETSILDDLYRASRKSNY